MLRPAGLELRLPGRRAARRGDDARTRWPRARGRSSCSRARARRRCCTPGRSCSPATRALAGVLERVVEFGALLAPLASTAPTVGARRPVAFHCSCHQRRGLRDTTSGATLISSLPNVELVEQADADACCGFGGTFAIKFPGVSTAMGRDKVDRGRTRRAPASSSRATSAASCTSAAWPPRTTSRSPRRRCRSCSTARAGRREHRLRRRQGARRAPRQGARRHRA